MDYRTLATQHAQRAGISPDLYAALIKQESGWNPTARSPVGAMGLTQIMPATARDPGFGVRPVANINDPNEQLRFGADYLATLLDRYEGDVPRALAAYNWGAGNADKWSGDLSALPEETRGYIRNITGMAPGEGLRGGEAPVAAGLREAPPMPEAPEVEEEPSWFDETPMGRFRTEQVDPRRDALRKRLGLNEKGAERTGDVLAMLGLQMMRGGL